MITLDVDLEQGNAFGYVVSPHEVQMGNYLEQHTSHATKIVEWLRQEGFQNVALLKSLNVDDDARGRGVGSELLSEFLVQASESSAECIVLLADKHESQQDGFSLVEWYKNYDFEMVLETVSGPLMVGPSSVGLRMKESLSPQGELNCKTLFDM